MRIQTSSRSLGTGPTRPPRRTIAPVVAAPDVRRRGGLPAGTPRRTSHRPSEQTINGRLVRSAGLLLIPAFLLLAFTIGRPGPFPAPVLPPSFDGSAATALAAELARDYPDRAPGSPGADRAAGWVKEKLGLYGLAAREDAWNGTIPGLGRVRLRNLVTVIAGASPDSILFISHRDNSGVGPGANDNASGTAALIELVRGYGRLGTIAGRPKPQHTLIFLSSDGGAFGGFGAERFAATSPLRASVRAVVSLDALAGSSRPRLETAGFAPRSPAPALVRTADVRIAAQLGRPPARPWLARSAGCSRHALRLRRAGAVPRTQDLGDPARQRQTTRPRSGSDTTTRLDRAQFVRLGSAAESILASLDGGIELAGGTAGYVYLGSRIVRGWAIEFVLHRRTRAVSRRCDRPLYPLPPAASTSGGRVAGTSHTPRCMALDRFRRRPCCSRGRLSPRFGDSTPGRQSRCHRLACCRTPRRGSGLPCSAGGVPAGSSYRLLRPARMRCSPGMPSRFSRSEQLRWQRP